jgi:hypothetical protein
VVIGIPSSHVNMRHATQAQEGKGDGNRQVNTAEQGFRRPLADGIQV